MIKRDKMNIKNLLKVQQFFKNEDIFLTKDKIVELCIQAQADSSPVLIFNGAIYLNKKGVLKAFIDIDTENNRFKRMTIEMEK